MVRALPIFVDTNIYVFVKDLQGDEVDTPIHRSKIKPNLRDGGSTRRVKVRMTVVEHGDVGNIINERLYHVGCRHEISREFNISDPRFDAHYVDWYNTQ